MSGLLLRAAPEFSILSSCGGFGVARDAFPRLAAFASKGDGVRILGHLITHQPVECSDAMIVVGTIPGSSTGGVHPRIRGIFSGGHREFVSHGHDGSLQ